MASYTTSASWNQLGKVTLTAKTVGINGAPDPLPIGGTYGADEIEIRIDPASVSAFRQIFESVSGSYPPGWILDANGGYPTNKANFWNWADYPNADAYPPTTMGSTGGYAFGARIKGLEAGLITWEWDYTLTTAKLILKGPATVTRILYAGAPWDLEMCLLEYKGYTGPAYPSTSNPADTTPPVVTVHTPANLATNVDVNSPNITITFSEDMDLPASATYGPNWPASWIQQASIHVYNSVSKTLTITPTSALPDSTSILVTSPPTVADLAGNLLPSSAFTFTTGATATAPVLKKIHFVYQAVSGSSVSKSNAQFFLTGDPLYQITNRPSDYAYFFLEYDQPLDNHTAHPSRIETRSGSTTILALVDITEVTAAGSPYADLNAYILSDDWKTQDGTYSLTGRTMVTFDKLQYEAISLPVADVFDSTLKHNCLIFQVPPGQLKDGHTYNLFRVPNQIDNMSGQFEATYPVQPGLMWDTAVTVDVTAPTIVARTPAPSATNVSVNTPITITFSEDLDPATVSSNWIPYPATISYSSKVITVTPSSPLPGTTTINVTAPVGITDTSGNALVSSPPWAFTTETPPDTRVPIEAYAIGFEQDPDNFKSIPLTSSGTITQKFKIPAKDIDGSKTMYVRLRDEDGNVSPNYRVSVRVLNFELIRFEITTDRYLVGNTNTVEVLFDLDSNPLDMEYGFEIDDSNEPATWTPVTSVLPTDIGEYIFTFNLDVTPFSNGPHELYVWLKSKEGEKEFRKVSFVSEQTTSAPYGTLIVKKTLNDGFKKKVWLEANLFDDGVGVAEYSLVDTGQPQIYETINIIQNRKITKLFEYDALANTTNTFTLDIKDAAGESSSPVTATVDLSSVY